MALQFTLNTVTPSTINADCVVVGLFANGSVQADPERIHKVTSLACAVHHLVERVKVITPQGAKQAYVIATNVYQKMPQGWRMVAHHASPGTPQDLADIDAKPNVLH